MMYMCICAFKHLFSHEPVLNSKLKIILATFVLDLPYIFFRKVIYQFLKFQTVLKC